MLLGIPFCRSKVNIFSWNRGEKREEKTIRFLVAFAFILCCWVCLWDIGIHDFFPWTRTYFASHDKYIELLEERSFYANRQFIDEVPDEASSVKYYCHQSFKNKMAAHSIVLNENMYKKTIEKQSQIYKDYSEGYGSGLIYLRNEDKTWFVDDLEQLGFDESFLNNVIHKPEAQHEYYCFVVISVNTACGIRYTGVIANDTTHEMIEFSVEIPDEH